MTQYLSRKERRDAERSGIPVELTTPQSTQIAEPATQAHAFSSPIEFTVSEAVPVVPAEIREELPVNEESSVSKHVNAGSAPLSR
ncbi:MAG: hypothetical protein RLZZ579_511, partial [Actinomycetota bacterium]